VLIRCRFGKHVGSGTKIFQAVELIFDPIVNCFHIGLECMSPRRYLRVDMPGKAFYGFTELAPILGYWQTNELRSIIGLPAIMTA
jgi:hypothetical protein